MRSISGPRRARLVTAAAAATALALTGAPPAGAGEVIGAPLEEGLITPLGLAVVAQDNSALDLYVTNSFAGFLTKNGEPIAFAAPGGGMSGVDVAADGTVAYTTNVPPELAGQFTPATHLNLVGSDEPLADLGAYEAEVNPDGGQLYGLLDVNDSCLTTLGAKLGPAGLPYTGGIDSNPYAVVSDGETGWYVADAAANAVLHVTEAGVVSTVAVLPPVKQVLGKELRKEFRAPRIDGERNEQRLKLPRCAVGQTYYGEPVPTDVELVGDLLYVSLLPGFPEQGGQVVTIDLADDNRVGAPLATGLAGAVDLAVGGDGTVYVAELFGNRVSAWREGVMVDDVFVLLPGAVEVAGTRVIATGGVFTEGFVVELALG